MSFLKISTLFLSLIFGQVSLAETGLCSGLLDCCQKQNLDSRIKITIEGMHSAIEDYDQVLSCEELELYAKDYTEFYLDLGGLQTLEPFADQFHIKKIYTRGYHPEPKISDLSPIRRLYRLEELTIRHMNLEDLTPLMGMGNLRRLDLSGNDKISNIDAVRFLSNLEEFTLECEGEDGNTVCKNPVMLQDISPLGELVWLKRIVLKGNQISDISPLKDLINLEILQISKSHISSIPPLNEFRKLKRMDLSGNRLTSFSGFAPFKYANRIELDGNPISSLEGMEELKEAETITLRYSLLDKVEIPGPMPKLREFDFLDNPNGQVNFQSLCQNTSIEEIYLIGDELKKFDDLKDCLSLKSLALVELKGVEVDISSLPKNLERLEISGGRLKNINFSHFTQLRDLNLNRNELKEFSFKGLGHLQSLSVTNNELKKLDFTGEDLKLIDLNLHGNKFKAIPELKNLPNLNQFRISENPLGNRLILPGHPSLEILWLENLSFEKVQFRGYYPRLDDLVLSRNKLKSLKGLKFAPVLSGLDLDDNNLKKLPRFPKENQIISLNVNFNKLKKLSYLDRLTSLQILEVKGNPIGSNIKKWPRLTSLHTLVASNAALKDLGFLKQYPNVTTFDLSQNAISNMDELLKRDHLYRVDIGHNPTTIDFEDWAKHIEIKNLSVIGVKGFKNIEALKKIERLNTLKMGNNAGQGHKVLEYLPFYLERFTYQNMGLEDLTLISQHPNISYLYLKENPIEDYSLLNRMEELVWLEVDDCPSEIEDQEMIEGCGLYP